MYLFIEREKALHHVATMCRVLAVSTSGYYAWQRRGPSLRARVDDELMARIRQIHQASRGTYGAPRVHAELRLGHGISCGRKRVARLMRRAGLSGIHRRRNRGITRRDPHRKPYPDLVRRDFTPLRPNRLWVADLTQHATSEGWLYLGIVLDAFSRKVVGWSMGDRPQADLTVDAVTMAIRNRRPDTGLVHHSDQGAQYTALTFGATLRSARMLGSMGHVGDALDNAVAESFFATLQTELLDRRGWPTRQTLRTAIFDYIEAFYNPRRRHSTIGYLSPSEFERRWLSEGRSTFVTASTPSPTLSTKAG
jgi:putative transposase